MADRIWTIRDILEWTRGYLEGKGDDKARLAAEWLLCDAMGLTRVELYTNYDRPLNPEERRRMREGVERRANGEPLQYITGEMPFRHIVLKCKQGVLIPRPETEVLVDVVLEQLKEPGRVLDLCTGTGCIACSIAKEVPESIVIATDIAPKAAKLADRNARALNLGGYVDVFECDLAEAVIPEFAGTFDVVVSNPPYIPSAVLKSQIPAEVKDFEPALALDGGEDGLDVFRRILEIAPGLLKDGGLVAFELYEESLEQAAALMEHQGVWSQIEVREDLTHRPRIVRAIKGA